LRIINLRKSGKPDLRWERVGERGPHAQSQSNHPLPAPPPQGGRERRNRIRRQQPRPSKPYSTCQTADSTTRSRSRGVIRPSFVKSFTQSPHRGRRECRASGSPTASRVKKTRELVTASLPKRSGIPRAMVLTVSFVVSLAIGLSCHHRRRIISADLIPASRYQDATTSPSALPAVVCCNKASTASRAQRS
jgi:hypothetical protein